MSLIFNYLRWYRIFHKNCLFFKVSWNSFDYTTRSGVSYAGSFLKMFRTLVPCYHQSYLVIQIVFRKNQLDNSKQCLKYFETILEFIFFIQKISWQVELTLKAGLWLLRYSTWFLFENQGFPRKSDWIFIYFRHFTSIYQMFAQFVYLLKVCNFSNFFSMNMNSFV